MPRNAVAARGIEDTVMNGSFEEALEAATGRPGLFAEEITTFQVNVGLRCNLECRHCHVASGPWRKEEMDEETFALVLAAARRLAPAKPLFDFTGGAPEMNPNFRAFVARAADEGFPILVRTNLTILLEPSYADLPEFFRTRGIRLVASLPCYQEENVDAQRGAGVFQESIEAIRRLNAVGYGIDAELPLTLVYNPLAPALPPSQEKLEAAYRRELRARFGLEFTRLITITNLPIGRFRANGTYLDLLRENFNPATIPGLMCRHQIEVAWDGTIYDCDFHLAERAGLAEAPQHIRDFDPRAHARRRVRTDTYCFGCTAGAGSSCGGAIVPGETA